MTDKRIEVSYAFSRQGDVARHSYQLVYSYAEATRELFYEMPAEDAQPVTSFDGAVCALIGHAMKEGADLILRGPATRELLRNINEYQAVWGRWLPDTHRPIKVEADGYAPVEPVAEGPAISAFSGGVDATFSVLRNLPDHCGPHGVPVEGGLLVHGFDIQIDNHKDFEIVLGNARRFLGSIGVKAHWVRTNSKLLPQDWELTYAAQLAGCLHHFSPRYRRGLIGSGKPYEMMMTAWGTGPITDPLMSGANLRIVHDGAAFSRTQKVEYVSRFPSASAALRVCWEGSTKSRNCSRCEKCVRTMINFKAVGVDEPGCFDRPLTLRAIRTMHVRDRSQLLELKSIVVDAERNGRSGPWLDALRARVRRGTWNGVAYAMKEPVRAVGLMPLAKKIAISTGFHKPL